MLTAYDLLPQTPELRYRYWLNALCNQHTKSMNKPEHLKQAETELRLASKNADYNCHVAASAHSREAIRHLIEFLKEQPQADPQRVIDAAQDLLTTMAVYWIDLPTPIQNRANQLRKLLAP